MNKTNSKIEGLKCFAHDEGFNLQELDYGVRLLSKNGNFLLDIWAKHNKRRELLHYTVHEWIGDRWTKKQNDGEVQALILNYKRFLYSPKPHRVVQNNRRY